MSWRTPFGYWMVAAFVGLAAYPLIPGTDPILGNQLTPLQGSFGGQIAINYGLRPLELGEASSGRTPLTTSR